jgi:hypothetical protein
MKNPFKPNPFKIFAAAGLAAAFVSVSQAQPYYAVGDYNGWSNPSATAMTGGPVEYSYTITGQTPGGYGQVKVTDGTWANTWPGNNMVVLYDSTGSATIHFYPGSSGDGWLPLANRVGYDSPDNSLGWGIAGDFDSWNGLSGLLPSIGSGVYSNSFVVATAGTFGFKFQSPAGSWSYIYFGADFGNNNANGSYTTTNSPQTVPVVLDLPNGRYLIGSLAPAPVTNQVVFAVDMSSQIALGLFHPEYSVFVSGDFNSWPGTGTGALLLTNVPTYNGGGNTNIYYGTNTIIGLPGSVSDYKFTDNDPALPSSDNGYEQYNNRILTLLTSNGTLMLPVVSFGNLFASDILSVDTPVFFSVDMMSNGVYVTGTDGHQFDPGAGDNVYINGQFINWYAWESGTAPVNAPAGYQMIEEGLTTIYTNTIIVPAGTPVDYQYKYGMDPGGEYGGPLDDEAGFALNHVRVVRSTAFAVYINATDTFGYQYAEPYFTSGSTGGGNLSVGNPTGGTVPVTWLGRPGAHLQVNTDLTSGTWQDIVATDGTTWTAGYSSTNGFVSETNWPASSSKGFFRLIIP